MMGYWILNKAGLSKRLVAFSHLVELPTINRWLAASTMGFFYFSETFQPSFDVSRFSGGILGLMFVLYYVMAINDCFDVEDDRIKSKLTEKKIVVSEKISLRKALLLSVAVLFLGLVVSWFVSKTFFLIATLIVCLSTFYSVPPVRYKQRFPLGTFSEFAGSLLLFLCGYSIFDTIDLGAVILSFVFSFITMYWRFYHESLFHDVDLKTGKRTFATEYGPQTARALSRACLLCAVLESLILFVLGWFSIKFAILLGLYFFFTLGLWFWFTHNERARKLMKEVIEPTWGLVFVLILLTFLII